jgi:hypothetical protein
MGQLTRVTVTMRELDRLKNIQAVSDGELKPIRAAERLELTSRQVRRLTALYRDHGPVGLISRRRSQRSNHRLNPRAILSTKIDRGNAGCRQFGDSPRVQLDITMPCRAASYFVPGPRLDVRQPLRTGPCAAGLPSVTSYS